MKKSRVAFAMGFFFGVTVGIVIGGFLFIDKAISGTFTEISCEAEGDNDTFLYCKSDYKCSDMRQLYIIVEKSFSDYRTYAGPWCSNKVMEIRLKKKGKHKDPCPWRIMSVPEDKADQWYDEGWEPFGERKVISWESERPSYPYKIEMVIYYILIKKRVCEGWEVMK